MDILCFPKFFYPHLDPERLAVTMKELGFDGVDIMIREASWSKEGDYKQTLPQFANTMRAAGLKAYTVTTDWSEARIDALEDDYRLFADNGITMFRYWFLRYGGFGTFHELFERGRKMIAKVENLSQKYGVQAIFQTHGGRMTWSCEAAYFMLQGYDPKAVGVHYDPGNLTAQEGFTGPEKAVDILREYLAYVGVKNAGWFLAPNGQDHQRLTWKVDWTLLKDGIVKWPEVLGALKKAGFKGPLCMHNFYENTLEGLTELTRDDVVYLRRLMHETGLS